MGHCAPTADITPFGIDTSHLGRDPAVVFVVAIEIDQPERFLLLAVERGAMKGGLERIPACQDLNVVVGEPALIEANFGELTSFEVAAAVGTKAEGDALVVERLLLLVRVYWLAFGDRWLAVDIERDAGAFAASVVSDGEVGPGAGLQPHDVAAPGVELLRELIVHHDHTRNACADFDVPSARLILRVGLAGEHDVFLIGRQIHPCGKRKWGLGIPAGAFGDLQPRLLAERERCTPFDGPFGPGKFLVAEAERLPEELNGTVNL